VALKVFPISQLRVSKLPVGVAPKTQRRGLRLSRGQPQSKANSTKPFSRCPLLVVFENYNLVFSIRCLVEMSSTSHAIRPALKQSRAMHPALIQINAGG